MLRKALMFLPSGYGSDVRRPSLSFAKTQAHHMADRTTADQSRVAPNGDGAGQSAAASATATHASHVSDPDSFEARAIAAQRRRTHNAQQSDPQNPIQSTAAMGACAPRSEHPLGHHLPRATVGDLRGRPMPGPPPIYAPKGATQPPPPSRQIVPAFTSGRAPVLAVRAMAPQSSGSPGMDPNSLGARLLASKRQRDEAAPDGRRLAVDRTIGRPQFGG